MSSSIKTEERAVSAVTKLINSSEIMSSAEIKEGDRNVSFDGCIPIYFNDDLKKKNFKNKIDIQIKGRTVKKISTAKNLNFSMPIDDIINYKRIGGAILFLVQIDNNRNSKIYIKSLLPYEVNQMLNFNKNSKSTISLNFEYVEDCDNFEVICQQFLKDKQKQYSYIENFKTKTEIK